MGESSGAGGSARLKECRRDLKRVAKLLDTIQTKLNENETGIEETQQHLQNAETSRTAKANTIENLARAIRNHQKSLKKGAQKRAALTARLQDVSTQVRNLGVLPEAAFSPAYANLASDVATARLHKKYGHVNKKAFKQFAQFERQRETLESRREELGTSDGSIPELLDHLDQKKDEAIERTFRQVSREFARVSGRLVPAGRGRLIIQRRTEKQARQGAANDSDEEEPESGGVENYIGVGISVSFNSKHDEQQRIQQLSGGQKSLCALALVFAIQASDPAPFYLFDEIDANLDAQYRTAVAELLQDRAQTGQFICTTFRSEMLLVAEKCYGVSYLQKASTIDVVTVAS
ncbi:Structural maintenance of chromosomes protein 3 [Elasticomyces elasticus]|nr:Structural maintenance of chromosomes protein 3 [Elasticomyces elasticus]KAK5748196.1 Structural maintenance of chromosomes protein 3 [Elasticomyces elasticus]